VGRAQATLTVSEFFQSPCTACPAARTLHPLLVHTLIESEVRYGDNDYTFKRFGKRTERWRALLDLQCRFDTGACIGAVADLGAFETGRAIEDVDFHAAWDWKIVPAAPVGVGHPAGVRDAG
jgi:hypothetical protein